MHENSFELLEEKILKAVRRIKELAQENERLKAQRQELEVHSQSLKDERDRMSRELDEARSQAQDVERMEDTRKKLEEKVGGLLSKLESIE